MLKTLSRLCTATSPSSISNSRLLIFSSPFSSSRSNKDDDVSLLNRDPTSPPRLILVQPRLRPEVFLQAKLNEALCLANSLEEQRDGYFHTDFFDKPLPPHVDVQTPSNRIVMRASGGCGFISGAGETELQLQPRRIIERRNHLLSQIEEVRRTRALQRAARKRQGELQGQTLSTVAIVGYTNVGKSTLVSELSDSYLYSDDRSTASSANRRISLSKLDKVDGVVPHLLNISTSATATNCNCHWDLKNLHVNPSKPDALSSPMDHRAFLISLVVTSEIRSVDPS